MSVLIEGMEMPKEGTIIAIYKLNEKFYACVHGTELCPLVPVPPHGRLIDADALMHDTDSFVHKTMLFGGQYVYSEDVIKNAPTIVEAEEVYNKYTDTAGNLHWTGTRSGEHTIRAEEGE